MPRTYFTIQITSFLIYFPLKKNWSAGWSGFETNKFFPSSWVGKQPCAAVLFKDCPWQVETMRARRARQIVLHVIWLHCIHTLTFIHKQMGRYNCDTMSIKTVERNNEIVQVPKYCSSEKSEGSKQACFWFDETSKSLLLSSSKGCGLNPVCHILKMDKIKH